MALVYQEAGVDLAFPGAESFARLTSINWDIATPLWVRNLNGSGVDSLRAAIESAIENRLLLFDTGGTIAHSSALAITTPKIYIAGQTAPPDSGGICVTNTVANRSSGLSVEASDVILRQFRVRTKEPNAPQTSNQDSIRLFANASSISGIILDGMSLSWSTDGTLDITAASGKTITEVTVQWSNIVEALHDARLADDPGTTVHPSGPHSRMMSIGSGNDKVGLVHNLLAHANSRLPRMAGTATILEVINNIFYNWVAPCADFRPSCIACNFRANYFKRGPSTTALKGDTLNLQPAGAGKIYWPASGDYANVYEDDSQVVDDPATFQDLSGSANGNLAATERAGGAPMTLYTAYQAYDLIRAQAGTRFSRNHLSIIQDAVDSRIETELAEREAAGGGAVPDDSGTFPTLAAGTPWIITGTGNIPDSVISGWGLEVGLNWDKVKDTRGRTYLQIFVEGDIPERIITVPPQIGPEYGQTIVVTTAGPGYGAQSGDL